MDKRMDTDVLDAGLRATDDPTGIMAWEGTAELLVPTVVASTAAVEVKMTVERGADDVDRRGT